MPSERRFYRQVIQFEILSEEPIPDMPLEEVARQTMGGRMSGKFLSVRNSSVSGPLMAKLLIEQDTSPDFFMLTIEGDDNEEWKEENNA